MNYDWVMIVAVLLSPLLAVQVEKYIERSRENRRRKLGLFYTLMSTRGARLSAAHVEALNMIDIEFYNNRAVIDSWKIYLDHLNDGGWRDRDLTGWVAKTDELFVALLFAMSKALKYNFDIVHLKRGAYFPIAHGEMESEQNIIRSQLAKILSKEDSLSIEIKGMPPVDSD